MSNVRMRTGILTTIRHQMREKMLRGGDVMCIEVNDLPAQLMRVKATQAAKSEGISVEIRTIDGSVYARRTDMATQPTLPGIEADPTLSAADILLACRPWPDDPLYDDKMHVLKTTIAELKE